MDSGNLKTRLLMKQHQDSMLLGNLNTLLPLANAIGQMDRPPSLTLIDLQNHNGFTGGWSPAGSMKRKSGPIWVMLIDCPSTINRISTWAENALRF